MHRLVYHNDQYLLVNSRWDFLHKYYFKIHFNKNLEVHLNIQYVIIIIMIDALLYKQSGHKYK